MISLSTYPIYGIIFWSVIAILSLMLVVWLFFAIYNGYRYEIFQIIAFIFLILAISLPEILPYDNTDTYTIIGAIISIVALCIIFLGIFR